MRIQYSATLSLALGTLLLVGAGCMPADDITTNTATTNTSNVDATTVTVDDEADVDDEEVMEAYEVEIIEPVDGDVVTSTFDVTVDIEGLTLAPDKVEGANVVGEGHYHVWVDGEYVSPGVAETTTLENVAVGTHEVMVSLQNNDHTDLDPKVISAAVTVTVE